jgi:O-antigen/teichoic acid export membrane protein
MGVVIKQSFKNTVTTYLGFAFGAVNALFLYTNFLTEEYYGLVTYLLSTANIMMPLMAFGVHNTIVKFYSSYTTEKQKDRFLSFMILIPMLLIIPVGFIGYYSYDAIASWLAKDNEIVKDYVWLIFITAVAMAYFEVFYAWVKVQLKSVYGNFLKEVFHRICITVLLFCVHLQWLSVQQFIYALVGVYILRMMLMKLYAYALRMPKFSFSKPDNLSAVLKYSMLIILAGSVAVLILDIDKFMIEQYLPIENVAFYGVAVYIATVIAVPSRAMHQITYPLTAKLLNEGNKAELLKLYQKSSLTLFIIGGLLFLLILLNIEQLYLLIDEAYRGAVVVVFLIGLAKLFDNLLGNNNAILFSSDYYRVVLFFGVMLALLVVTLNIWLIPTYGIYGAAAATFGAVVLYNTAKLWFVNAKFKMNPFTIQTFKALILITSVFLLFYFWDFTWHPVISIAVKGALIGILYLFLVYRLNLSDDISNSINHILKRKTR